MVWNINTIIPFFALVTYGAVFLVVIFARPYKRAQQAFRGYLLSMLIWSLAAFITLAGLGNALIWFRILVAAAIGSLLGMFHFVKTTLAQHTRWDRWIYLYGFTVILLILFTNLAVRYSSVSAAGTIDYEFSPLISVIAGPGYALMIHNLVALILANRRARDANQRNRLRYLIIGVVLIVVGSLVNWTPIGIYPVDIAINGISALIIAYAILRYQLLDISLVVRQGLLYSIPTTIVGTAYFLIISLALNIFHAYSGLQIFFLSLFVAVLTALVAQPFHQRAQSWLDKFFFRDKYDTNLMLQNFSNSTASIIDLDRLTSMILEEITANFYLKHAAFFLKEQDSNRFYLAVQLNLDLNPAMSLREGHPIVLWLSEHEKALTRDHLEVNPAFKALWKQEREDLTDIGAEIFIPIKVQTELIGILALGPKLSDLSYSSDDELTLTTLANQSAMAIENATLYDAESTRREELGALYNLTRQLLDTNQTEVVLGRIASNVVQSVHVTFAGLFILEEDGDFHHMVTSPELGPERENLHLQRYESAEAHRIYHRVIRQERQLVYYQGSSNAKQEDHKLMLGDLHSVCVSPLLLGEQPVGVLLLGEARNPTREPFDFNKLRLIDAICDQAASALSRVRLHEELEENFLQTIVALANAMDARDTYTHDHSERLADLAEATLKELGGTDGDIRVIHWAALLHDLGKIGVADGILRKPGSLSEAEWIEMRKHPEIGAEIIRPVKQLASVAPIIHAHHEKFDGSGYPLGLIGDAIPLSARVLTVVDSYGAMIDNRTYRKAMSKEMAVAELQSCAGTHFDPTVVDAFLCVLGRG
jgi:putative nucleotidyltransferase with HDIG domain